ncbi:MAG: C69 family dipeptidase [Polyangia bacterium]
MRNKLTFAAIVATLLLSARPTGACTSIVVGKDASTDGSVITTHTVDSHRTSTDVQVVPHEKHAPGETIRLTRRKEDDSGPMQRYGREPVGEIPQVRETYGYLSPAYAPMNEHQLAIGESTFGGREELRSEKGLLDCETTQRLMMERAATAREAIEIGGALIEKHGWNDEGEALTIVDPDEAWVMEIVGPGEGEVGAIWIARRVPDDHVSVEANASRICEVDLDDSERFMASKNVISAAEKKGYWNSDGGDPFEFCWAYAPEGRTGFVASRREWRVFDLLAPSLELDPDRNVFPFSIKPDEKVSVERVMEILRDTYEGTPFDMTAEFTVTDEETGKTVKSPLANPFMPYDANKLFDINGGWGWRGERTIARWYTMYATITQSRSWLPDPVGGIVWFGYDNTAMTTYVPIYIGVTGLPEDYQTDGRTTGFSRESAWWAFNRVGTLAAHRWGEMREDVARVRDQMQEQMLEQIEEVDATAKKLHARSPKKARRYLTEYVNKACASVVEAYWKLGDHLWTAYDEKW